MFSVILILSLSLYLVQSDRTDEGYASGLLRVCPGSDVPLKIPKSKLDLLQFTVVGKDLFDTHKYSYSRAVRGIASDRRIDFRKRKTVIFISGWPDFNESIVTRALGQDMKKQNANVILLETVSFTAYVYPRAARLSRDVGHRAGAIFAKMAEQGLDPKRTHVIGLSLGAHTASYMATTFRNLTGVTLDRLTGIDPAGPCFRTLPPEDRLDSTDADHVDVIHTNIDIYGMAAPMGHVDFYVNGGEYQPNDIDFLTCIGLCSHLRAYFLWRISIDHPGSFVAIKCDSVQQARDGDCYDNEPVVSNVLGPETDFGKPGIYYLATSNLYPYYLGKTGLSRRFEYWQTSAYKVNKVKFL